MASTVTTYEPVPKPSNKVYTYRHRIEAGRPVKEQQNLTLAQLYEIDRDETGATVAEWEQARGLPQYSVYPEKRGVPEHIVGHFMYTRPPRDMHHGPRNGDNSVGVQPKKEPGCWGPTKVGGEQAKQPSHHWMNQKHYLGNPENK